MLIEDHLRRLGYTSFDFAGTEAEAVTIAHRRRPDLITADVRLPQGCGVAAVEAICCEDQISVVFITATAWEVRERMRDAIVVRRPIMANGLSRTVTATGMASNSGQA